MRGSKSISPSSAVSNQSRRQRLSWGAFLTSSTYPRFLPYDCSSHYRLELFSWRRRWLLFGIFEYAPTKQESTKWWSSRSTKSESISWKVVVKIAEVRQMKFRSSTKESQGGGGQKCQSLLRWHATWKGGGGSRFVTHHIHSTSMLGNLMEQLEYFHDNEGRELEQVKESRRVWLFFGTWRHGGQHSTVLINDKAKSNGQNEPKTGMPNSKTEIQKAEMQKWEF